MKLFEAYANVYRVAMFQPVERTVTAAAGPPKPKKLTKRV